VLTLAQLDFLPSRPTFIIQKMEPWNPDLKFLQFLSATSPKMDTPRFVVSGEQKTLGDLIHELKIGTDWGRGVYTPLHQAYFREGPLHKQYQSWREQQSSEDFI